MGDRHGGGSAGMGTVRPPSVAGQWCTSVRGARDPVGVLGFNGRKSSRGPETGEWLSGGEYCIALYLVHHLLVNDGITALLLCLFLWWISILAYMF